MVVIVLSKSIQKQFQKALGIEACLFDPGLMPAYSGDNSKRTTLPSAVFFPRNEEDVMHVVAICREHQIPITARGLGSGTPGGAVPLQHGVVVVFTRMNQVLEFSATDRTITVQSGITNGQVQKIAGEHGLFWPPNPSSQDHATVGGNLAYNSAGPSAVKYGSCRDYTLGLTAITGRGEVIHTGCRTTKGVVGYDLTRLLIGSEGTLALITSATLQLMPFIPKRLTLQAFFSNASEACGAIGALLQLPTAPIALEMMDSNAIELIASQGAQPPAKANVLLMIEYEVQEHDDVSALKKIIMNQLYQHQSFLVEASSCPTESRKLWALRKALSPAQRNVAPDKINEDVVVPISQLAALMAFTNQLHQTLPIHVLCFGHAGNGNMHVNFLYDKQDPIQHHAAQQALPILFEKVLALGGSLSGEHGVGLDKAPYIEKELGATNLHHMRAIKRGFDPDEILNPDKIFYTRSSGHVDRSPK